MYAEKCLLLLLQFKCGDILYQDSGKKYCYKNMASYSQEGESQWLDYIDYIYHWL